MEDPHRTRPSAIVQRIDPSRPVSEFSTVELLAFCLGNAQDELAGLGIESKERLPEVAHRAAQIGGREFTLAAQHIEDAITRFNKGVYKLKGTFAISDAERS